MNTIYLYVKPKILLLTAMLFLIISFNALGKTDQAKTILKQSSTLNPKVLSLSDICNGKLTY